MPSATLIGTSVVSPGENSSSWTISLFTEKVPVFRNSLFAVSEVTVLMYPFPNNSATW